ncbi:dephospho-CoA kinase [Fusobacterium naviforme]|uniref:Dephospho-CoA kinase n=1 Tax=Moryella indoligenes TaxID=371674 RepID=A0AAE4AK03_9FIRM|nr:dephospho-CoA kinase [Moryella indoligenes]MDQ0152378.1 dephospho-CoA kinase [Moryella indoligenes]PSL10790.1 dephospho-CoA kinase [Fusobacterium naviforme]STO27348.1 Dephospho-CoA kinase [Fusobacterium naviforme]
MVIELYGGVGSGKSEVLRYLRERYGAEVIGMDETAHALYEPGKEGYCAVLELLGTSVLDSEQKLDRGKMADILYADPELFTELNRRIHPLVYREVHRRIRASAAALVVVETALPAAVRSDSFDEIWYVYTPKDIRAARLKESRGYSEERIREIMERQPTEAAYRALSDWVLVNSGSREELFSRIDQRLKEHR